MKKLITLVITIVITTMSYAQELHCNSNMMCEWDYKTKKWDCQDTTYWNRPIKFTFKNNTVHVNDKNKSVYHLDNEPDSSQAGVLNGVNWTSIGWYNTRDEQNKKCVFIIYTLSNGQKTVEITYKNFLHQYFIN